MSRASVKPKRVKQKAKQAETAKGEKAVTPFRPAGEVPKATVLSRHGISTVTRFGRGFSAREFSTVGLDLKHAGSYGIQVDLRRGSLLEDNVARLKSWFKPATEPPKPEKVLKMVKEEKAPAAVKGKRVQKAKPVLKSRKRAGKKSR
jgi:ribosomal protein L13E